MLTSAARTVRARPRLFASIAVAVLVYLLEPSAWRQTTRLLIAWNVGTTLDIILNLAVMARSSTHTIIWRAKSTDDGRFAILILVSLAALASIGAIVAELNTTKDLHGAGKTLHLALATTTLLSAWTFIHLSFALHYAHEYFDAGKTVEGEPSQLRGGVQFPGTEEPDYWDFLYFAFIIGVAAQTADVSITSKAIRRTSLAHSVLAFFFNSAILALTINIAAGLI